MNLPQFQWWNPDVTKFAEGKNQSGTSEPQLEYAEEWLKKCTLLTQVCRRVESDGTSERAEDTVPVLGRTLDLLKRNMANIMFVPRGGS